MLQVRAKVTELDEGQPAALAAKVIELDEDQPAASAATAATKADNARPLVGVRVTATDAADCAGASLLPALRAAKRRCFLSGLGASAARKTDTMPHV